MKTGFGKYKRDHNGLNENKPFWIDLNALLNFIMEEFIVSRGD